MHALSLFEENERLRNLLNAVEHTLTVHGKIDCETPLHRRISSVMALLDAQKYENDTLTVSQIRRALEPDSTK